MIPFYAAASLLLALALALLLPPLLRRRTAAAGGSSHMQANVALYRQQLQELEADVRSGTLSAEQFDSARRELERRLLDDASGAGAAMHSVLGRSPRLAIAVGASVPIAALLIYAYLGTPQALTARQDTDAARGSAHTMALDQIGPLAERLAAKLQARPDDAQGWAMLARTYGVLGRQAEALSAYAKAAALAPGDAQLLADYADALAVSNAGRLAGPPMQLVTRALEADPRNVKALALAGTEAFDNKRYRDAVGYWQRGFEAAEDGSEFKSSLGQSLAEARALAGIAPGPAAARAEPRGAAAPAGGRASKPAVAAAVSGTVTIAPALAKGLKPTDTVFVFARAVEGPRMPLAMLTKEVKDLPVEFVLDDASAMMPGRTLSDVERVVVIARVSRSGSADPQPGDVEGRSRPVTPGARGVNVTLDTALR